MFKKWLARTAVTAAVGAALVAGITSPAYAADTNIDLVYDSMLVGEMRHVDDGDDFRVYDWYRDGHGVKGTLQAQHPVTRQWSTIESKYNNTGGGTYVEFQYDVLSVERYRLVVCLQDGASDPTPIKCDNKTFTE
ncbi:hypothetical protein O1R50_12890 [Glycomyces luteolus]|uniref:Secreted protein n=1 Tax=Glycomyces luteolus TaxID=2670330 RepID=A0A9X3PAF5_9ACTN|nr:hypothetical protein [Glycomyces luteolus]MDA1360526.1 hypothetical protein [Glycomyces luteolus]